MSEPFTAVPGLSDSPIRFVQGDRMSTFDLNTVVNDLVPLITSWGLNVLGAIAVLVIGRWIAGWLKRMTRRASERANVDPTLTGFSGTMVFWLVQIFVIIAVLGIFGVPTASFVAVLGAAGLAVGLAFQGTLSNFASGVMLLLFRPISVGDFVEVGGTSGTVKSIGMFNVHMDAREGVRVVVPNSRVFGDTITNYNTNPNRRIDLVMGVDYGDDLKTARDTILRVVREDERVLEDPEPLVQVDQLGASSVDFVVRPWVKTDDYWGTRRDLVWRLKEELEAAGCSFPYPQRDVHLFQEAATA